MKKRQFEKIQKIGAVTLTAVMVLTTINMPDLPFLTHRVQAADGYTLTALLPDKVYDGTDTFDAADVTVTAVDSGYAPLEIQDLTYTVTITEVTGGADVGDKTVTVTISDIADGDENIDFLDPNGDQTLTLDLTCAITAKPITEEDLNFDVAAKQYDGTRDASVQITAKENVILAGDDVTFSATAKFEDKNYGEDKSVSIRRITMEGEDQANYDLQVRSTTATGKITPKAIIPVTITPKDKTYDGTVNAEYETAVDDSAVVAGDDVDVDLSGITVTFADRNKGTDKTIVLSKEIDGTTVYGAEALTLTGMDAGNYEVDLTLETADVSSKVITVYYYSVWSKTYDGTTDAVASLNYAGKVGLDDVNFAIVEGPAFTDAEVGIKNIITKVELTGEDRENYTLANDTIGVMSSIQAKQLEITYTGAPLSKVYDGTTEITGVTASDLTIDGVVDEDVLDLTDIVASLDDENVGTDKPVTITLNLNNSNYTAGAVTTTAEVTARELTVGFNPYNERTASYADTAAGQSGSKVYDGSAEISGELVLTSGAVDGDDVGVEKTEDFSALAADAGIGNHKALQVTGYELTGEDRTNYTCNTEAEAYTDITLNLKITVPGTYDKVYEITSYTDSEDAGTSDLTEADYAEDTRTVNSFNSEKQITLSTDAAADVALEYAFVSTDTAADGLGSSQLEGLTYAAYTDGCKPEGEGAYYLYVRAEDGTGAYTYFGEAGTIYDDTAPVVGDLTVTPCSNADGKLTVKADAETNVLESYAGFTVMTFTLNGLGDDADGVNYTSGLAVSDGRYTDVVCSLAIEGNTIMGGNAYRQGASDIYTLYYMPEWKGKSGTFTIQLKDRAGNTAVYSYPIEFGSLEPVVTLSTDDGSQKLTAGSPTAEYTNRNTLGVTVTDASGSSFQTMNLTVYNMAKDADTVYTAYTQEGDAYTFEDLPVLADGEYIATLELTTAGNVVTSYTYRFLIDTVEPEMKVTYDPESTEGSMDSYICSDSRTAVVEITDAHGANRDSFTITQTTYDKLGNVVEEKNIENASALLSEVWEDGVLTGYMSSEITFAEGYRYKVVYAFTDQAGNRISQEDVFTVDHTAPYAHVTDATETAATALFEKLSFGAYRDAIPTIAITAADGISPVATVDYYLDQPEDGEAEGADLPKITDYSTELAQLSDVTWTNLYTNSGTDYETVKGISFPLGVNANAIYYIRVTDFAGNVSYYRNGTVITVDDKAPSLTWESGKSSVVTNKSVAVAFEVTEAGGAAISGLKSVTYELTADNGTTETGTLFDNSGNEAEKIVSKHFSLNVSASKFNSNDITLKVRYSDQAGNTGSKSLSLDIDTAKPVITVTNETAVSSHGKRDYYNANEATTVSIAERNFSAEDTTITVKDANGKTVSTSAYKIGSWTTQAGTKANGDDTAHRAVITFTKAGDYQVIVNSTDAAGNAAATYTAERYVTVDKTNPVVTVTYDQNSGRHGSYYRTSRTATITVTEHNFDPNGCTYDLVYTDVNGVEIRTAETGKEIASSAWTTDGDVHTTTLEFDGSYNYQLTVHYKDYAKRSAATVNEGFTVDKVAPTGTVSIGSLTSSDSLKQGSGFEHFTNTAQLVTITATDAISPLETVKYIIADTSLSKAELAARKTWTDLACEKQANQLSGTFTLAQDAQVIVYVKLVDYAGNTTYLGTDGVIFDTTDPAPAITLETLSTGAEGNTQFYNGNVTLRVKVEDPTVNGAYAGLSSVRYEIYADGKKTGEGSFAVTNRQKTLEDTITVSSDTNNTNDIRVVVYAEDLAGNSADADTTFAIDATSPSVNVTMTAASDGRYYGGSAEAAATITVQERNFDPAKVNINVTRDGEACSDYTISAWTATNGEASDASRHTATLTFAGDGDYQVNISAVDEAANSSETVATGDFTVDRTKPVITLAVEDGKDGGFYGEGKTVTVTVVEHNFDPAGFTVTGTATGADQTATNVTIPAMSGWTQNGDRYTASFTLTKDGVYSFQAEGSDAAVNMAATQTLGLKIDQSTPSADITINGMSGDKMAFSDDDVTIQVGVTDGFALDPDQVKVTVKELITGQEVEIADPEVTYNEQYQDYAVDIDYTIDALEQDGLYQVTVEAADLAGNRTVTQEKSFALSRNGSVFYLKLADETENASYKLVTRGYTRENVDFNFEIREFNPSKLDDTGDTTTISVETLNHGTTTLTEGTDYTVTTADPFGGDNAGYTTVYSIRPETFAAEDQYIITIVSEDSAGNKTNSNAVSYMDVARAGENGISTADYSGSASYGFICDKTAPTALYEGIVDNGVYNASSIDFKINLNTGDLSGIRKVTVGLADGTYICEYDADSRTYVLKDGDGNELTSDSSALKMNGDGTLTVTVAERFNKQNISIMLEDFAGNVSSATTYGITVSTNFFGRLFSRTWMMVSFLFLLLLLLAAAVVAVIRITRKKK